MESFDFYAPPVMTISALTRYLRELLESDEILQDVWVRGEVSNFSQPRSGHLYFTLKDSEAQIRCVMWKNAALRLRFDPRDGMLVEAHGSMNIYEAGGQVQLYIDTMRPAGEGALYQEFLRLKARLETEGLFDINHKRPIPSTPKVIGVVTSATGAALQDILNTLSRRYPLARVLLTPTAVQGVEAPAGIVAALARLNQQSDLDVIILARGGGSIEDLWAFNDEGVARGIYTSLAPVISGIGHETDFTIADFVADLRAPTPTAAAELATPYTVSDLAVALNESTSHLANLMESRLSNLQGELSQTLAQLKRLSPQMQIYIYRQRLDEYFARCERAIMTHFKSQRLILENLSGRLLTLDPQAVLKRGFAIVTRSIDNTVVSRVEQAPHGEQVNIQVSNGALSAKIIEQEKKHA